jgi:hypothetical protein
MCAPPSPNPVVSFDFLPCSNFPLPPFSLSPWCPRVWRRDRRSLDPRRCVFPSPSLSLSPSSPSLLLPLTARPPLPRHAPWWRPSRAASRARPAPPGESRPGRAPPRIAPPPPASPAPVEPLPASRPPAEPLPRVAPPAAPSAVPWPAPRPCPRPCAPAVPPAAPSRALARSRAPAASRPARLARFACPRHAQHALARATVVAFRLTLV